jgi:hypothetical protein
MKLLNGYTFNNYLHHIRHTLLLYAQVDCVLLFITPQSQLAVCKPKMAYRPIFKEKFVAKIVKYPLLIQNSGLQATPSVPNRKSF